MKQLWTIFRKEVKDNVRDRRSLFFALLYGPVLMPVLMIGPLLFSANQFSIDFEQPRDVLVSGMGHAPHLVEFLHANNLDAVAAPAGFRDKIRAGDIDAVLEIPAAYGDSLRSAEPAELVIHYDDANDDSARQQRQLSTVLERYDRQLRALRFQVRGIDDRIFEPINLVRNDLSESGGQVDFIGYILPFLLIFSMMMGGFYLAVDTTAGERERLSLEPLMSLPISRTVLVLGKYFAILLFVLLAMTLPLFTSYALFRFLPEDLFAGIVDFGPETFITTFWLVPPLAFLVAGFLLAVASFARNTREAQTHLSLAMMVPLLPFFALQFLNIPTEPLTMAVPLLSQFKLMEMLVLAEPLPILFALLSVTGTLTVAALFLAATLWLFSRERILL